MLRLVAFYLGLSIICFFYIPKAIAQGLSYDGLYFASYSVGPLDKPVFFVEGYDPNNQASTADIFYSLPPDFLYWCGQTGHDLIIVDFKDGGGSIQSNASYLKKFINYINQVKTENRGNVVIGYSMGGLVARWALKDMEDVGPSHQTSVYVSLDAPHKGAVFPQDLADNIEGTISRMKKRSYFLERWLIDKDAIRAIRNSYQSVAAQQMLISGNQSEQFFKSLELKGYPSNLYRIGISLGSKNGHSNNLPKNTRVMAWKEDYKIGSNKVVIIDSRPEYICNYPCDPVDNFYYDSSGSTLASFQTFDYELQELDSASSLFQYKRYTPPTKFHTFVPLISALDIRNHSQQSRYNENMNRYSPFDKVYTNEINSSHVIRDHAFNGSLIGFQLIEVLSLHHTYEILKGSRTQPATLLQPVQTISSVPTNIHTSRVSWGRVSGATHYQVFIGRKSSRYANAFIDYRLVAQTADNSWVVSRGGFDEQYLAVQACRTQECSYSKSIKVEFIDIGDRPGFLH